MGRGRSGCRSVGSPSACMSPPAPRRRPQQWRTRKSPRPLRPPSSLSGPPTSVRRYRRRAFDRPRHAQSVPWAGWLVPGCVALDHAVFTSASSPPSSFLEFLLPPVSIRVGKDQETGLHSLVLALRFHFLSPPSFSSSGLTEDLRQQMQRRQGACPVRVRRHRDVPNGSPNRTNPGRRRQPGAFCQSCLKWAHTIIVHELLPRASSLAH